MKRPSDGVQACRWSAAGLDEASSNDDAASCRGLHTMVLTCVPLDFCLAQHRYVADRILANRQEPRKRI